MFGKYFVLQTDLTLAWFNPSWSHDFSFLITCKKNKTKKSYHPYWQQALCQSGYTQWDSKKPNTITFRFCGKRCNIFMLFYFRLLLTQASLWKKILLSWVHNSSHHHSRGEENSCQQKMWQVLLRVQTSEFILLSTESAVSSPLYECLRNQTSWHF